MPFTGQSCHRRLLPITLGVTVSDIDNDAMTVTFCDGSDDSVIGTVASVPSGSRAEVNWPGLAADTTYTWYTRADDGELIAQSDTWSFTTASLDPGPEPPGDPSAGYWTKPEIPGLLTKGTPDFADDDASELVHAIQWDEVPWLDESAWRDQVDGILGEADGVIEVEEVFEWVITYVDYVEDQVNYGVSDVWASPEQTLIIGGGDGADLAFLLASLLKFHTDEVDVGGGDLVYVRCGYLEPPGQDLRAWVYWGDESLVFGLQLDPTGGEMGLMFPPGVGTLWLNDEHAFGFLPGYYPMPAPPAGGFGEADFSQISGHLGGGFGDDRNNYAWSMTELDGDLYVGTARNPAHLMFLQFWPGEVPEGIITQFTDPTAGPAQYMQFVDDMQAEIWRYRDGDWELVHQAEPVMIPNPQGGPPDYIPFPEGVGYRIMTTFNGAIYAGVAGFGELLGLDVPNPLILTSTSGDPGTWEAVNHRDWRGQTPEA
jgi:hypothetical protein